MWVSSFYCHHETAEKRGVSLTCSAFLTVGGGGRRDVKNLSRERDSKSRNFGKAAWFVQDTTIYCACLFNNMALGEFPIS